MMQIVGTLAEFERAMLRERTRNGLDAARKRGRVGGRRPKLKTHLQEEIVQLVSSGQKTAADVARLFNIHPSIHRVPFTATRQHPLKRSVQCWNKKSRVMRPYFQFSP